MVFVEVKVRVYPRNTLTSYSIDLDEPVLALFEKGKLCNLNQTFLEQDYDERSVFVVGFNRNNGK
jgi:hypothetical protein